MRDPETRVELQEAVNAAEAILQLDSARQYGLVTGGPAVNVERCEEILEAGRLQGIFPVNEVVEDMIRSMGRRD